MILRRTKKVLARIKMIQRRIKKVLRRTKMIQRRIKKVLRRIKMILARTRNVLRRIEKVLQNIYFSTKSTFFTPLNTIKTGETIMATKKTPAKATAKTKTTPPAKPKTQAKAKAPAKPKAKAKKSASESQAPSPFVPAALIDTSWVLNSAFTDASMLNKKLQEGLPIDQGLTGAERNRLIGVKARNFGFITKSWEIIDARPEFLPPQFSMEDMSTLVNNLNRARDLSTLIEQLQRLVDDYMMTVGSTAFRDALRIYGQLQAMHRAKVPGATEIFKQLQQFFTLRRRRGANQPTEAEMERDFRRVLHGKADGEIFVKNESPRMTEGVHEVVDEVGKRGKRKAKIEVKE